jgi:hypothetical protein
MTLPPAGGEDDNRFVAEPPRVNIGDTLMRGEAEGEGGISRLTPTCLGS